MWLCSQIQDFRPRLFYFKIINVFDFFQSDFLGIDTKSGEEGLVSPKCLRNIGVCVFFYAFTIQLV